MFWGIQLEPQSTQTFSEDVLLSLTNCSLAENLIEPTSNKIYVKINL